VSGIQGRRVGSVVRTSAVIAAYLLITALIYSGKITDLDLRVRDWIASTVPSWGIATARILALLGQGGPLSLLALIACLFETLRRKTLQPIAFWTATFVLLLALVLPQKIFFRRGAPADPLTDAVEFFSEPFCGTPACQSYPSGHAANVVVWYGLIAFILSYRLGLRTCNAIRIICVLIVAPSTIISGYHWLTDTAAGLLLGVVVYAAAARIGILAKRLDRFVSRPH
jgi:membrane-associated phospholipid phosphatase